MGTLKFVFGNDVGYIKTEDLIDETTGDLINIAGGTFFVTSPHGECYGYLLRGNYGKREYPFVYSVYR